MKACLSALAFSVLTFAGLQTLRAEIPGLPQLEKRLAMLDGERVLEGVQSGEWPKLPALTEAAAGKRQSLKVLPQSVLEALNREAQAFPDLTDATALLKRTPRAAAISKMATSKGVQNVSGVKMSAGSTLDP